MWCVGYFSVAVVSTNLRSILLKDVVTYEEYSNFEA